MTVALRGQVAETAERQHVGRGHAAHPGQHLQPREQRVLHAPEIGFGAAALGRDRRVEGHQALGSEPQALVMQAVQALDQETGGHQQGHRNDHNQRGTHRVAHRGTNTRWPAEERCMLFKQVP